jgi:hypothetical protein
MIERAATEHGLTFPMAEFALSDPYKAIAARLVHSGYIARNDVSGVECDHLAFMGRDADLQVWLDRSGKPVPRKIVVNYRTAPGSPEYIAFLSDRKFPEKIPASRFQPDLPSTAKKNRLPSAQEGPAMRRENERPSFGWLLKMIVAIAVLAMIGAPDAFARWGRGGFGGGGFNGGGGFRGGAGGFGGSFGGDGFNHGNWSGRQGSWRNTRAAPTRIGNRIRTTLTAVPLTRRTRAPAQPTIPIIRTSRRSSRSATTKRTRCRKTTCRRKKKCTIRPGQQSTTTGIGPLLELLLG